MATPPISCELIAPMKCLEVAPRVQEAPDEQRLSGSALGNSAQDRFHSEDFILR